MTLYILIVLTIIALSGLCVVFFLFAIWRAILGKTGIDLRLSTSVDIQTKKIEALNKSMGAYDTTTHNLMTEAKEIRRHLKNLVDKNGKNA